MTNNAFKIPTNPAIGAFNVPQTCANNTSLEGSEARTVTESLVKIVSIQCNQQQYVIFHFVLKIHIRTLATAGASLSAKTMPT